MHRSALVAVRGMARNEASDLSTNGLSEQQWTPPVVTRATVASARGRFNSVQGISVGVPTFQRNCNSPGAFPSSGQAAHPRPYHWRYVSPIRGMHWRVSRVYLSHCSWLYSFLLKGGKHAPHGVNSLICSYRILAMIIWLSFIGLGSFM